jgi:hypothetical protein
MKVSRFAVGILSLLVVFNVQSFESAPSMMFVDSGYSGHEEITRQALNNISKKIKDTPAAALFELSDLNFDLNPEPKGLFGYKAKNMVILGNFASDFPKQAAAVSLIEFWNDKSVADFESPKYQVIHFLKNYKGQMTLDSAYNTCVLARQNIKFIVDAAVKAWEAGNKTRALFLIGHASHTIQDSFSTAHTKRDIDTNNNNLLNVCFYGNNMAKYFDVNSRFTIKSLCYHNAPDSRDNVWNTDSERYKKALSQWTQEKSTQCSRNQNYPENDEEKRSCLSHEARLSRLATEKFLFLVFNYLSEQSAPKKSLPDFLASLDTNLFDGPVGEPELDAKMANGIMRCEGLSTEELTGMEPMGGGG